MYTDKPGLRKLRKVTGRTPTVVCSNCKCKRYSVCTCKVKGGNKNG